MEGQPWPLWLEEGVSLSAFTYLWTVQQTTGLEGINEESLNKFENPGFKLQLVMVVFGSISTGAISPDASLVLQGRWWLRLAHLSQTYSGPHADKAEHSMRL